MNIIPLKEHKWALFLLPGILLVMLFITGCQARPDGDTGPPAAIPAQVEDTESIFTPYEGKLDKVASGINLAITNQAAKINEIRLYEYAIPTDSGTSGDKLYIISNPLHNYMPRDNSFVFALDPTYTHKLIVEVYDYGKLVCREFVELKPPDSSSLTQITISNPTSGEYAIETALFADGQPKPSGDGQLEMSFGYGGKLMSLGKQKGEFPWEYDLSERSRQSVELDNEFYGTAHFVNCGDIELIYLTNNDDGNDYLASVWSGSDKLVTYRGIAPAMSKADLFSKYSLSELGISPGQITGIPYRFGFDDGYSYAVGTKTTTHDINFYLQADSIVGIELSDYNLMRVLPLQTGDGQVEKDLYNAYFKAASKNDAAARAKVFELLPQADWGLYRGIGSTNQSDAKMDLFSWIWALGDTSDAELKAIMEAAATNLDGAYSQGFGYYYGNSFKTDPQRFLDVLARVEGPAQFRVIVYVAHEAYSLAESPGIKDLPNLSESQQGLLRRIIEKGEQSLTDV